MPLIERLLLFIGIEAGPESIVSKRGELFFLDEPLKRRADQFFAWTDMLKNLAAEDEIASVHPYIGISDRFETVYQTIGFGRHDMKRLRWLYGKEGANGA